MWGVGERRIWRRKYSHLQNSKTKRYFLLFQLDRRMYLNLSWLDKVCVRSSKKSQLRPKLPTMKRTRSSKIEKWTGYKLEMVEKMSELRS